MKSDFKKIFSFFGLFIFLTVLLIFAFYVMSFKIEAQEVPSIIFTEIMYDLVGSDSGKEWVEIYNRGSQPVEIIEGLGTDSWRFNDGSNHTLSLYQGDLVLESNEAAVIVSDAEAFLQEHSNFSGTIIDTVMSLGNTGDTLSLSNDSGQNFFTAVSYQSSWGAGGNNYSLEKIDLSGNDGQSNWQESTNPGGNPGSISQSTPEPEPEPLENHAPIAEAGNNQTAQINQAVVFNGSGSSDPDGDQLIFNWSFGDGQSADGAIVTHQYFATGTFAVILEVTDGLLNASDSLQIFIEGISPTSTPPEPEPELEPLENHAPIAEAGEDQIVWLGDTADFNAANSYDQDGDQLTYSWNFGDGQSADGATIAHQYAEAESYTVILIVSDGELEDQDILIIEVQDNTPSSGPSSGGGSNSSASQPVGYSNKIIINEILPNPVGPDGDGEFIELFNKGYEVVDLVGWQIQDNSSRVFVIEEGSFSSTEVQPGGYFVVTKNISGISLNNSGGDKVIIYQPDGNQLEMIEYSSSALEGKAYAKKPDGSWVWTAEATPGSQNSFIANQPPEAKFNLSNQKIKVDQSIEFDGSLSIDPDGDQIIYHWDFGDGSDGDEIKETHIFETSGSFNIILTVTDSEGLADASTKQVVVSLSDESPKSTPVQSIISDYNSITINEFLVNPVSSDDFEWIELFNNSSEKLDLSNLKIDDAAGGSQPFQLKELFIEPFGYLIINRVDSKIALNNSADSVRLLSAEDQVIQEVIYDSAKEGQSFSYNQILNDWFWSAEPTPGTENPLPFVGNFSISGNIDNQNSNYQISEIKELDKGAEVKTYGIITAVPGIFGKRSFYISEVDLPNQKIFLSPGIEIYSSRAEFLAMSIGDVVELSGKVSETQGRKRINLQNDSQINFIEHWEVPEPDKFATGELSDDLVGSLIKIAGVLLERKNSNYYLDDGSGELIMYLKKTAGIPKLEVGEGYIIEAVGILDSTDSGYRLLPRFPTDISAGQVLGEFEEIELSDEVINIEAKDQRKKMMKYLMFGGGGVMIILITIVIKLKLKINKDG